MVFKPSFKCFIKQKNHLQSSDSKTRIFVLSEYIHIISSHIKFVERFKLKKKQKKFASNLKNMPYRGNIKFHINSKILNNFFNIIVYIKAF